LQKVKDIHDVDLSNSFLGYETGIIAQTKAIILRRFYRFKSEKKQIVFLGIFTLLGVALKVILDKYPLGPPVILKELMNPTVKLLHFRELMLSNYSE